MAKKKEETAAAATTETVKKKKKTTSSEYKFYNTMTFEYMKNYIEDNAPSDKAWFKSVAFDSKGKYQHLIAKKAFCEKYMPDKLPKKKEKVNKSDILLNW